MALPKVDIHFIGRLNESPYEKVGKSSVYPLPSATGE